MTWPLHIVIDTNVFITALRSDRGASFKLLSLVGVSDRFEIHVSVPLILEYEDVATRPETPTGLSPEDIGDLLDYICSVAHQHAIFYLWRPYLKDPKDDMVLELAVEARCDYIITYNKADFSGIDRFGIQVMDPKEFLRKIGVIP